MALLFTGVAGCAESSDPAELEGLRERVAALEAQTTTVAPVTTSAALAPAEVFAAVSPSVVFVDMPDGTGSGVLLPSGYVVTNAHVVGHYPSVRLFTSAGAFEEVPVHARDWFYDLALLGPIPAVASGRDIPALGLGSSTTVDVGDTVYLVGYPGEIEAQPEPTITAGTLSRRRIGPCLDMTFLQTDATIAGGQSGGALVDAAGQLIGISGLGAFTESNFGLVHAAEDVSRVLAGLEAGSGNLLIAEGAGAVDQSALVPAMDSAGYIVTVTEEQPLFSATVHSPEGEDVWLAIDTWDGLVPEWNWGQGEVDYIYEDLVSLDEEAPSWFLADEFDDETAESLEVPLWPGIYVLSTGQYSSAEAVVSVEASSPLTLLEGTESPGEALALGKPVTGIISHIEDFDQYQFDLRRRDAIRIRTASLADPVMSLYLDDVLVASNDDADLGLYGYQAEIVFEAEITGRYELDVTMFDMVPAGYILTLDPADSDNPSC